MFIRNDPGVAGIAVAAPQVAAGQAHKNTGEPRKRGLPLETVEDFTDPQHGCLLQLFKNPERRGKKPYLPALPGSIMHDLWGPLGPGYFLAVFFFGCIRMTIGLAMKIEE